MTKAFLTFLGVLIVFTTSAQQTNADSLKRELEMVKTDTARALLFSELSGAYAFYKPDLAFYYASEGLKLARKTNYSNGEAWNLFWLATCFRVTGASSQGMQFANKGLALFKALNNKEGIILCTNMLGWLAKDQGDYDLALEYAFQAVSLSEKHMNYEIVYSYSTIAECYEKLNKLDSALIYAERAEAVMQDYNWNLIVLSGIQARLNHDGLSLQNYRKAILRTTFSKDSSDAFIGMAKVFDKIGQTDSAIYYAKKALGIAKQGNFLLEYLEASELLAKIYNSKQAVDSTLKYMQISADAKDSLFSQEKVKQFQSLVFNEKLRQQEVEADKMQYRARTRTYVLLIVIGFFLFLAIILYRNNKIKQRANAQLQQQKEKIETTLAELKATQAQLIQSEKMASLGELTAGIAHEIQNPLNFVNNFSDVNKELLAEMKDEIAKGNYDEVKAIADDVIENEGKINHHGKQADGIVKGMLQHSRSSSAKKESTDINKLADDYLRLAYHGLRGKDKDFNATLKTDYDETIGNINIIPQDIGRAILNLITNALYAVGEKKKQQPEGYEPTIFLRTKKTDNKVLISVKDNGNGISQKVLDKIFQPFFTTKPTGQGTGLGLSLSYDIVKAHSGELKVETNEGKGAEFIIVLPV